MNIDEVIEKLRKEGKTNAEIRIIARTASYILSDNLDWVYLPPVIKQETEDSFQAAQELISILDLDLPGKVSLMAMIQQRMLHQ